MALNIKVAVQALLLALSALVLILERCHAYPAFRRTRRSPIPQQGFGFESSNPFYSPFGGSFGDLDRNNPFGGNLFIEGMGFGDDSFAFGNIPRFDEFIPSGFGSFGWPMTFLPETPLDVPLSQGNFAIGSFIPDIRGNFGRPFGVPFNRGRPNRGTSIPTDRRPNGTNKGCDGCHENSGNSTANENDGTTTSEKAGENEGAIPEEYPHACNPKFAQPTGTEFHSCNSPRGDETNRGRRGFDANEGNIGTPVSVDTTWRADVEKRFSSGTVSGGDDTTPAISGHGADCIPPFEVQYSETEGVRCVLSGSTEYGSEFDVGGITIGSIPEDRHEVPVEIPVTFSRGNCETADGISEVNTENGCNIAEKNKGGVFTSDESVETTVQTESNLIRKGNDTMIVSDVKAANPNKGK